MLSVCLVGCDTNSHGQSSNWSDYCLNSVIGQETRKDKVMFDQQTIYDMVNRFHSIGNANGLLKNQVARAFARLTFQQIVRDNLLPKDDLVAEKLNLRIREC